MSTISSPPEAAGKPPKKRVVTPARKEQNRLAQKLYRQRQKERKDKGSYAAERRERLPALRPKADAAPQRPPETLPSIAMAEDNQDAGLVAGALDDWATFVDPQESFIPCLSGIQLQIPLLSDILAEPSFPHTLPVNDSALCIEELPKRPLDVSALPPSQDSWVAPVEEGSIATNRQETSSYNNEISYPTRQLPSPQVNALQTSHTTIFSALLHNGVALGFDLLELSTCTFTYMSPFYRPDAKPQDDLRQLTALALSKTSRDVDAVPAGLRPTLAQVLIPHHASLDLIPFPQFRDRVIMLSAGLPHLFNLWELKMDIYVYGALDVSVSALKSGTCQPWNWKSWGAAPWFLQKWSMAVNSEPGRRFTALS